jgi:hypothetical protein
MQPEARLRVALAQKLWTQLHETGHVDVFDDAINALGAELGVPEHLVDHVTRQLVDNGWLYEKSHGFFDGIMLARGYGEESARDEWRAGNRIRSLVLQAAVTGYETPSTWSGLEFSAETCVPPIDAPFEAIAAAAKILESLSYVEIEEALGTAHYVALTPAGYELARDEDALRRTFPRTATEDEEAHVTIVPDVLSNVITSCEQMLRDRAWTSSLDELGRGDARYAEKNWSDAVSEYYSAVESGLRYLIDEAGEEVGEGVALETLAKRAAELA